MQVLLLLLTLVVHQVAHVGCLRCPALMQVMPSSLIRQADGVRKAHSSWRLSIWSVGMKTHILQEIKV